LNGNGIAAREAVIAERIRREQRKVIKYPVTNARSRPLPIVCAASTRS